MRGKYIRIMLFCCSAMLCLTSTVYAQEKKGKAGDVPPAKAKEYPSDYAQEKKGKAREYNSDVGFKGPSQPIGSILVTKTGQIQATPAASAKSLAYDTPVMLVGNITQSIGGDLYTFKDTSGEITVRITHGDWKGLSIEASDGVVIAGYVKSRSDGQIEIDVKMISKTKM